jgi:hypothetical protein
MAYIGNQPELTNYTISTDKFNGTGACTQFTLTRNISDANALSVVVNGIVQTPIQSYTVTNGLLTFDEAPSLGTTNITVNYLASSVITYANLGPGQITAGAVTSTSLATNSVTTEKIVAGAVTGDKIGLNAVSGNNIVSPPDIFDDVFLFGGM